MSFNPASYAVAGFVDVTNMSHANRKRLAQNDDEGYMPTQPAVFARPAAPATIPMDGRLIDRLSVIQALLDAASRFARRTDDFSFGKPATCRDMAEKLQKYGTFVSDKQTEFAYKLIGWSVARGSAHPLAAQEGPVQAPASPVAAPKLVEAPITLPKLFALMQRLAKLTIGKVIVARKNGASLCWVKLAGRDGVVGKIEGGTLVLFMGRMGKDIADELLADLLRIEADPEAAAALHGKLSGRCSVCSRDLTDPESIERGIGPICLTKF